MLPLTQQYFICACKRQEGKQTQIESNHEESEFENIHLWTTDTN